MYLLGNAFRELTVVSSSLSDSLTRLSSPITTHSFGTTHS
jgi:hypothetical protein